MSRAFFLFFLLSAFRLFSQVTAAHELLTTQQGLSQGMIYDVLQGRDGFLWLATKDGLNRYDGYIFKIFSHDPFDPFSIGHSEIHKLFEDSRGRLWIIHGQGLDVFLPSSGRFFHLLSRRVFNSLGKEQAYRAGLITEAPDGTLYITDPKQLWKIAPPDAALAEAEKTGNAYPELAITSFVLPASAGNEALINSVYCDQDARIWLGTERGLWRLDAQQQKLLPEGLEQNEVYIIGADRAGRLWLEVTGQRGTALCPTGHCKWRLCVRQPDGDIKLVNWIVSDQDGQYAGPLFHFDASGHLWYMNGGALGRGQPDVLFAGGTPDFHWLCTEPFAQTPGFYMTDFDFDDSGIIWIGTNGFGAVKYNPVKPKFSSALRLTSQRAIHEDCNGRLLLQINQARLYLSTAFDRSIVNPLPHSSLTWLESALVCADDGSAWLNTQEKILSYVDRNTSVLQQFAWQGRGLVRDSRGLLYGASEKGLHRFDPRTLKDTLFLFESPRPLTRDVYGVDILFAGRDDVIWFLAFEGLVGAIPDRGGFRFVQYRNDPADRNSLYSNRVMCVAEDPLEPARYLWVGTKGGGLNRLDRQTGRFVSFRTPQGLPDDVVYGILTDDHGHLWLSTNKGLCRFHVRSGNTKIFTEADGLPHNEFNQSSFLKMRDGVMIFGGVNGLTVFHPDSLRFNEHLPQMHIVGVNVNNVPLPLDGPATLSYDQNFLSFEFAALELTHPGKNRYRYQLVRHGLFGRTETQAWLDLGEQHNVQLANLSPGNYIFRVLGSNNDGYWSTSPAEFHFVIRPPWWAGWGAILLYVAIAIAVISIVYRYQLSRRLVHQETRRLRELDDFKSRFFTNITHEFRTPLTVILGISEQWMKEEPDEQKRNKLELVRRNGANLLRLINQILDLSKLESSSLKINYVQGDVSAYLRYIVESLHSFANAQNVLLRMEIPASQGQIMMDYDPERLLQIVYNLLSNAIKFTPSGGQVILSAQPSETELQLSVADTGAGISPEELPLIFDRFYQANNLEKAKAGGTGIGLALTKELIKLMGGDIAVKSELGKGSTFTVTLPITNKANQNQGLPNFQSLSNLSENQPKQNNPPATNNRQPATDSQQATTKSQILLIEDNPDVVEYLVACLQGQYALNFAYNGRAGIEKALETIPDLIISDVMMPGKDGFEVCEALKNDERSSHIPIVLLTAKAGVENRIAGLRRGADAYLSKPFHQEELLVVLANLLEGRRKLQAKYRELPAPDSALVETAAPDPEDLFLQKVRHAILEHLHDSSFSVDGLCRVLAMSQPQLHRKLSALTGTNATLYMRAIRLNRAKELLLAGGKNVSEVAFEVGFDDPKYFSRVFAEMYGVPPSKM